MDNGTIRGIAGLVLVGSIGGVASGSRVGAPVADELFFDDFEGDLDNWEITDPKAIRTVDSGDPERGRVLALAPSDARLCALIRGSEAWSGYRMEGFFLFPDARHNYLGFIYNLVESETRVDLGSVYIKGNGSYIRANPRRDWNPGRSLYEEWRVELTGASRVEIGRWHDFALEVVGNACHLYVGDDPRPQITFDLYEGERGKAGFKPRVVGGPVRIDDVLVTDIDGFSYEGPRLPASIEYRPDELVTNWHVLGPLTRTHPDIEKLRSRRDAPVSDDGRSVAWKPFATDARGAVVTGRVVDFLGDRTVAYFSTTVDVAEGRSTALHVSTIDDLAVWVNGRFEGYYDREGFAWHDMGRNPEHPLDPNPLVLGPGENRVLFRVRGGIYATGGFFVRPETR